MESRESRLDMRDSGLNVDELHKAYEVAKELAYWAMNEMSSAITQSQTMWTKRDAADWATDADVRIEQRVRETVSAQFPTHRITGEEQGTSGSSSTPYTWYVDPIDGTCNFAHGVRWNAFSLALALDGEPIVGVVADPYQQELFHACVGQGAFANDQSIQLATETPTLAGEIVMMELANHQYWPGMNECMRWLSERLVTARIMGSSALSVVHAGTGRAVGAVLGGSNPIDVAAAVLIAREAGATVIGRNGDTQHFPREGLAVGHPGIAQALWQSAFGQE